MQYRLFDTTTRWQRLAAIIELGGEVLEQLHREQGTVPFQPWFVAAKEKAAIKQLSLSQTDAEWIWEVLRSEPSVQRDFGALPAAGSPWFSQVSRFDVLDKGECFSIGLRPADVRELLSRVGKPVTEEAISVRLLEKLQMRPGKGRRLECCRTLCQLTIKIDEPRDAHSEAARLKTDTSLVTVNDQSVTVLAKSLNHAYTMASRRLEQDRRSHGGPAYEHLVYVGQAKRLKLEQIRKLVETGDWEVPIIDH